MKAIVFGIILGVLLLWPAALDATAQAVTACAQPAVLAFVLGVLARPGIARRVRRWTR